MTLPRGAEMLLPLYKQSDSRVETKIFIRKKKEMKEMAELLTIKELQEQIGTMKK